MCNLQVRYNKILRQRAIYIYSTLYSTRRFTAIYLWSYYIDEVTSVYVIGHNPHPRHRLRQHHRHHQRDSALLYYYCCLL